MLPLKSWRIVSASRALLHPNWPMTKRQCVYKAVTCSAQCLSTSFPKEDIWESNTNFKAPGKERKLISYTNPVSSPRNYCTGQDKLSCWNCKQTLDKTPVFFCMSCKVVQPPEEGTSYFKLLDCDYTFTLDTHKLQRSYLQLQRSLHPDNFSQKSVKEQKYSEIQSALVNKAYKTLLKPLSRGLYMLELEGMRIEEGTDSGADSGFLMELMEINEALDEAQTPEAANKIGEDTKGKLADLTKAIDAALLKGELQAAKALLAQMKYYANIEEKVKEKLSEFM
ncbi:iron-sulfur cluster co-chaperone protein HscB [Chelmon rostratus]|uniref:iron-sulfur cluster co-chaperone protein HscB n=1 Tax=Chelmon rostratus TaxID=109905 RepID=UPI001BEA0C61|nr:iron-sulfur cluster co-chaperone protein HscB [Chelmon rostratus]XP_041792449.1 iron-sulfur cluster co-chaperone protein HscB [Chelmon rostratus]XP_041792450.1 iron-sulfur cluster co-chaperone protein HscB [Chelmon rostratus]